jgi:hypothetical protein
MNPMIVWPDGLYQPAPSDSYTYFVPNSAASFQWDEQAFSWIDSKGDYCYFEVVPMVGHGNVTYKRTGLMPIHNSGNQGGQIVQAYEELSSFFKESNTSGTPQIQLPPICECGAHKIGSNKHSVWCRVYKE